ncbi:hypothetical protein CLCR_01590 [Cladophialophora carrionii]|uniref:Uncharacterized protein n=1 Tax=Cladophialophora carrionii TaxID=86049 RepID=A0A1C1CBD0_9EURO|nr:hypothetical protein CLCR_01590 [Cladophialophora carrionii]
MAQPPTRRGTSLISCYCTCRHPPKNCQHAPSISSGRSNSSLGKDDPLYPTPGPRPGRVEREQWQRRRNSLSSQKAIYPHRYQWHDQRPRYASYNLQASPYSSTLRSVSEGHCLELSDRNSSMTSSQSSKTWATTPSTRPSTISSSRSRASSNPERGDLRREKPGEASATTAEIPDVPPLPTIPPPAWAPALHHAPLSADPTLRALSTGAASRPSLPHSRSSPDLLVQPLNIKKCESSALILSAATSATKNHADTKTARQPSPRKQSAPPMPSGPPPPSPRPPPPVFTAQPQPGKSAIPIIPTRAPGHSVAPVIARAQTGTSITSHSTSSSTATTTTTTTTPPSGSSSLRRPNPIRYRHYYHNQPYNGRDGLSQTHLPLQQYQHQRVWRHVPGGARDPSVYSASSYGTRTSPMTKS